MGPSFNWKYLYNSEPEDLLRQRQTRYCDLWAQRAQWCGFKPRKPSSHQKLQEAKNGDSPKAPQTAQLCWHLDLVPWDWFRSFGLQNSNTVHFFVLSHQVAGNWLYLQYGTYSEQIKEHLFKKVYRMSFTTGRVCGAWAMMDGFSDTQNRPRHCKENNHRAITLMTTDAKILAKIQANKI